jgi:hypothetical protein
MLKIVLRHLAGYTLGFALLLTGFAAWAAPATHVLSAEAATVKLVAEMTAQAETCAADSLRSDLRKDGHGYRLASADEYDGLSRLT